MLSRLLLSHSLTLTNPGSLEQRFLLYGMGIPVRHRSLLRLDLDHTSAIRVMWHGHVTITNGLISLVNCSFIIFKTSSMIPARPIRLPFPIFGRVWLIVSLIERLLSISITHVMHQALTSLLVSVWSVLSTALALALLPCGSSFQSSCLDLIRAVLKFNVICRVGQRGRFLGIQGQNISPL